MSRLLRKPDQKGLAKGITLVHDVTSENSSLEYVGFKMIDLVPGAKYTETLGKQECCIVAVTGQINVSDQEVTFNEIGTRESVFEKKTNR